MKKEINLLRIMLIAAIVVAAAVILLVTGSSRVDYNMMAQVRIKRSGTMIPSGDEYMLTLRNGEWIASCNRIEWLEDNIQETTVSKEFAREIREILAENKAEKWDGFHKRNEYVTDGEVFEFYMRFSDGTEIEASGYEEYPRNFFDVFDAFEERYAGLFAQ